MRLIARGQKIGGNVAFGRDEGDYFDFFVDLGQFCEKFRIGIAL